MKQKKNQNKSVIISIVIASMIVLIILGSLIYLWGKSEGYEKRGFELEEEQLESGREASRLSSWERDLFEREENLSQTLFNISDYQNKKKELGDCKDKLEDPAKFNFIVPFYYSHTEIGWLIISITLIFPITLALFQVVIKDKDLRIFVD